MRLFCYTYGHNEIELLPLKLKWCEYHGMTMRYFDNESTDGSKEWAYQAGVLAGEIISDGAFDLRLILPELNEDLIFQSPDWFCMLGVDLFICPPNNTPISELLSDKSVMYATIGLGAIECVYTNICYTGTEIQNGDLRNFDRAATNGAFSMAFDKYTLLVKYMNGVHMAADKIVMPDWYLTEWATSNAPWYLLNFGHTKTALEREETFKRRILAWERGLSKYAGAHYSTGHALKWVYPKDKTILISDNETLFEAHKYLMKQLYE